MTDQKIKTGQKIVPMLWFDKQAEEAAEFYTSIFKIGQVLSVSRYGKEGYEVHGMKEGTAMLVEFELFGQRFSALNGGPNFKFNESISFVVGCGDQAEVDYYWENLMADGGEESQCGWLKDKFGVSWQITPIQLEQLMSGPDKEKTGRVFGAMMQMKKIIIKDLENAYEGK